jgi:pimeloyl-ACP methyl ester carboxylesterase
MSRSFNLQTSSRRRIACVQRTGTGPGVVFLGGFRSNMTGTKARFLDEWAERAGRAFLRFDYSGHGASSGRFEDGCISEWTEDALSAIACTEGPQILVGSSMGLWIALLVAKRSPVKVAGIVGISGAPDFTENEIWPSLDEENQLSIQENGFIEIPATLDQDSFILSYKLIEDGNRNLVFRAPLRTPFPVRLFHGTADTEVPLSVAFRLLQHAEGDIQLTVVKGADHRFSTPACLQLLSRTVEFLT